MAKKGGKHKPRQENTQSVSLADQLFVAATLKYERPEADFLPPLSAERSIAIENWRQQYRQKLEQREVMKPQALLKGKFAQGISMRWFARAALFLVGITAALYLFLYVLDDTIRIEDESGKSAMGTEIGAVERPVHLRVMRKRHKIGEITVEHGSRLKVVKTSNGDAFRSEMAFAGAEADFKLRYTGKASVIINNGPFKAKVRIPASSDEGVHLKFREIVNDESLNEPQFAIEVIKGNVHIAEADDDDEFEHFRAGEKAIFSLDDSENL